MPKKSTAKTAKSTSSSAKSTRTSKARKRTPKQVEHKPVGVAPLRHTSIEPIDVEAIKDNAAHKYTSNHIALAVVTTASLVANVGLVIAVWALVK